jgi:hypothetical protein
MTKFHSLTDQEIQMQSLPAACRLCIRTAIRAGKVDCYADTAAAAQACCDAKDNVKNRHVGYSAKGNVFYCEYSDDGTGDWD